MSEVEMMTPGEVFKAEVLEKYPPKLAKKRGRQIVVNEAAGGEVRRFSRTADGSGNPDNEAVLRRLQGRRSRPTRDVLQITHGPIGCGFYSWLTRRNQTKPHTADAVNFMPYAMSTICRKTKLFSAARKLKRR